MSVSNSTNSRIANLDEEIGVTVENPDLGDGAAMIAAGQATLALQDLPSDQFSDEASFENVYGQYAINYLI